MNHSKLLLFFRDTKSGLSRFYRFQSTWGIFTVMGITLQQVSKGFLVGLRFFFTFPLDLLVAWPLALLVHATSGKKGTLKWENDVLNVFIDENSWLYKKILNKLGALTIGHAILWIQGQQPLKHEGEHVEQIEGNAMYGFLVFLVMLAINPGAWWLGLLWWMWSPSLIYICASLRAVLAGGHFYRNNNFEVAAYDEETRK